MSQSVKAKKQNQNQTPAPQSRGYSVQSLSLGRYMELESMIKELTKERDTLKEHFKHKGSHSTSKFVCSVTDRSRTNPPSLKKLVEVYGPEVKDLCTVSEFKVVSVSRKGGE